MINIPEEYTPLLENLHPETHAQVLHGVEAAGRWNEALRSLHFLSSCDTARLEKEAAQFSAECARILNDNRAMTQKLKKIFEILPYEYNDGAHYKESLTQVMGFLSLFCIDDGKEARPMQPQTALARLREDPKLPHYEDPVSLFKQFRTHTYWPHSLLDMVAEDCCNANRGMLDTIRKDTYQKLFPERPDLPHHINSLHWLSRTEYDGFVQKLRNDLLNLSNRAIAIRESCMPSQEQPRQVRL